jgi:hypothetical protein
MSPGELRTVTLLWGNRGVSCFVPGTNDMRLLRHGDRITVIYVPRNRDRAAFFLRGSDLLEARCCWLEDNSEAL